MSTTEPLTLAQRVVLWDGALSCIRSYLREEGLAEVSTRVRLHSPAVEPHIQPLEAEGQFLATSPELEMKRALAAGSGPIFQVAHVFREGEIGPRHREEFHLVEWYRLGEPEEAHAQTRRDVEQIVERVGEFAREHFGVRVVALPKAHEWQEVSFDELWEETVGMPIPEDRESMAKAMEAVSEGQAYPLSQRDAGTDPDVFDLDVWSSLFSWWSDRQLEPWLIEEARAGRGVHLYGFPPALAALSRVMPDGQGRMRSGRYESYLRGAELANGYVELRDSAEQRLRFEQTNALRARYDRPALPIPEPFCEAVGRLPECSGVAMGLERLLCTLFGTWELAAIRLCDGFDDTSDT